MTKSTIRSNLSEFTPDITATRRNGLEYVLGETNRYILSFVDNHHAIFTNLAVILVMGPPE